MRATLLSALFGLPAFAAKLNYRAFPHLIIPLRADAPDTPQGTKPTFEISKGVSVATSWDVPVFAATHCDLGFSFNHDPVLNAPKQVWGVADNEAYLISILELPNDSLNKEKNTWNSHPAPKDKGASGTLAIFKNGTSSITWAKGMDCQKGQVAQFLLQSAQPDKQPNGGVFWYELDYNPPNGLTYDLWLPDWTA